MRLLEHVAKCRCRQYGIPTLESIVVYSTSDVEMAWNKLRNQRIIAKAQSQIEKRARWGGIKVVSDLSDCKIFIQYLFDKGLKINGKHVPVESVLLERFIEIESEFIVQIEQQENDLWLSHSLDIDIDTDKFIDQNNISKIYFVQNGIFDGDTIIDFLRSLNFSKKLLGEGLGLFYGLWKLFLDFHCTKITLSPLVTYQDQLFVLGIEIDTQS
ncbi:MAG: hypothetical protein KBC30_11245 [Planctomycetes bacterium]|nr:hypothetical protein [Planctomycetota bacterium]HRU52603.1 hypothetical protein [Planctomycetota bacterium]